MTRPTKPRHAIQPPLLMPAPLHHLGMRGAGYQMMVRQRYPVTMADLAGRGALARVERRRWGGSVGNVGLEDGVEEVGDGGGGGVEEGVGF